MPHKADAACGVRRAHARRHRARRRSTWSPSPTTAACAGRRPTAKASSARCATRAFDPAGTDVLVARRGRRGARHRARARRCGCTGHGRGPATRRRRVGRRRWCPAARRVTLERRRPRASTTLVVNATPLGMQGEPGPVPRGAAQPGPVGGRHRVPPHGDPLPRRRPRPRRSTPSTASACSCTRPRSRSSRGPASTHRSRRCASPRPPTMEPQRHDRSCSSSAARSSASSSGGCLDPVITRVPRQQARSSGRRSRRRAAAVVDAVAWSSTVLTGALFGATAARFDDSWAAARVPRAHRRARRARGHRPRDLPPAEPHRLPARPSSMLALLALGAARRRRPRRLRPRARSPGVIAFAIFFVLHLVSPRSMGFGDVKLSFVLGLSLGWLGWGEVVLGLFLGFLYGAVIGLVLIATQDPRRRARPSRSARSSPPARSPPILVGDRHPRLVHGQLTSLRRSRMQRRRTRGRRYPGPSPFPPVA